MSPRSSALLLIAALTAPGCGFRDCATEGERGRGGELVSFTFDGPAQAVETAARHYAAVITYAWFEYEAICAVDGVVVDPEHDPPFPVLESEDEPGIWGGWREQEGEGACYGPGDGCEPWPDAEHTLRGPWISAEEWYAQIWWPMVTGFEWPTLE
jgi:hypothetical protein